MHMYNTMLSSTVKLRESTASICSLFILSSPSHVAMPRHSEYKLKTFSLSLGDSPIGAGGINL